MRLLHGDMDKATVCNASPANQAEQFAKAGFDWLHVVDLNGAIEGRAANAEAPREGSGWQTVAKARSYVWLEARARYTGPAPISAQPLRLGEWTIPLIVAGKPQALRGAHEWLPAIKNSKK